MYIKVINIWVGCFIYDVRVFSGGYGVGNDN